MGLPFYVVFIVMSSIAILAVVVGVTENRQTLSVLLGFYVIAVLIITLLVRTYDLEVHTIINPFSRYVTIVKAFASEGSSARSSQLPTITEILLNILLFVPFGFLAPERFEKMRWFLKILLAGCLFSFSIELAQLILHMGCFDTSDIVHNTLGAICGYGIWRRWISRGD